MSTVSDEAYRELSAVYGPGLTIPDMLVLWYAYLGYMPEGDLYKFFGDLGAVGATVNDRADYFWRVVGLGAGTLWAYLAENSDVFVTEFGNRLVLE